MPRATFWTGMLVLALGACQGRVEQSGPGGNGPSPGSPGTGGTGSTPGTGTGSSTGMGTGSSTGSGGGVNPGGTGGAPATGTGGAPMTLDCAQPRSSVVQLTTLTESQFNNSVLDIFQLTGTPANGLGQILDDVSLEQRAEVAATVAAQAVANMSKWAPCTPPATGSAATCEQQIITKIGAKLYRRPLTDADKTAMTKLFDAGVKEKDFSTGVEWFLTGLLQSPHFVDQVVLPLATEKVGEVRPLGPYEYASRLAFFVWDGPPDDALTTAAANNDLSDATKRDAQVTRMIQDPRFSRGVAQFYSRWLNLNGFREAARDVPEFTEAVANGMATSLLMSATELYKSATPNISALFSGETYYLNDVLRTFYKVSGTGTAFTAVAMPGQARRGILTHPGLMALLARPEESFPIGRGLFMLRNVLCKNVDAPPAGLVIPPQPPEQDGVSTRERLETHTSAAICQSCHSMINPAGFAFENYDEVGRYRTMDHGRPVNTSGTLTLGKDIDGPFATGDEFLAKLPQSQSVRLCFAEKYLDFALAHPVTDAADTCSIQTVGKAFSASGDLKQLVVSVTGSDSFRMRLAQGVGP